MEPLSALSAYAHQIAIDRKSGGKVADRKDASEAQLPIGSEVQGTSSHCGFYAATQPPASCVAAQTPAQYTPSAPDITTSRVQRDVSGVPGSQGNTPQRTAGVRQSRNGTWQAFLEDAVSRQRVHLGCFQTADEAAAAYDQASRHGPWTYWGIPFPQPAVSGHQGAWEPMYPMSGVHGNLPPEKRHKKTKHHRRGGLPCPASCPDLSAYSVDTCMEAPIRLDPHVDAAVCMASVPASELQRHGSSFPQSSATEDSSAASTAVQHQDAMHASHRDTVSGSVPWRRHSSAAVLQYLQQWKQPDCSMSSSSMLYSGDSHRNPPAFCSHQTRQASSVHQVPSEADASALHFSHSVLSPLQMLSQRHAAAASQDLQPPSLSTPPALTRRRPMSIPGADVDLAASNEAADVYHVRLSVLTASSQVASLQAQLAAAEANAAKQKMLLQRRLQEAQAVAKLEESRLEAVLLASEAPLTLTAGYGASRQKRRSASSSIVPSVYSAAPDCLHGALSSCSPLYTNRAPGPSSHASREQKRRHKFATQQQQQQQQQQQLYLGPPMGIETSASMPYPVQYPDMVLHAHYVSGMHPYSFPSDMLPSPDSGLLASARPKKLKSKRKSKRPCLPSTPASSPCTPGPHNPFPDPGTASLAVPRVHAHVTLDGPLSGAALPEHKVQSFEELKFDDSSHRTNLLQAFEQAHGPPGGSGTDGQPSVPTEAAAGQPDLFPSASCNFDKLSLFLSEMTWSQELDAQQQDSAQPAPDVEEQLQLPALEVQQADATIARMHAGALDAAQTVHVGQDRLQPLPDPQQVPGDGTPSLSHLFMSYSHSSGFTHDGDTAFPDSRECSNAMALADCLDVADFLDGCL